MASMEVALAVDSADIRSEGYQVVSRGVKAAGR